MLSQISVLSTRAMERSTLWCLPQNTARMRKLIT